MAGADDDGELLDSSAVHEGILRELKLMAMLGIEAVPRPTVREECRGER